MTYQTPTPGGTNPPSASYETTFQQSTDNNHAWPEPPPLPKGGEKFGAWFDHETAQAAVDFFALHIRHTEAEWYGKAFILSPWQEQIVRQIFGWKRRNGLRLIRQVYIEIPRKNGKTEFAAALSLLVMLGDGEMKGQGYFLAVSKEQANDTVFEKTRLMVGLSETLSREIEVTKTSLYCPALEASFKPMSSKAGTKQGFSPTFLLADELHVWPDGEVHEVVRKGMGARRQPLEILLTTAGEPNIGYGWQMHEYAENVISGTTINPTFLAVIFAADPKDDWRDPATWAKANPNLNISVKEDFLAEMVMQAEGNARLIGDFKRYHLNIWNSETTAGIPMPQWDACRITPVTLESLKGRNPIGALDLSSTQDITALTLGAKKINGEEGVDLWWHFWIPKEGLAERCRHDKIDYMQWIADGFMTATDGASVDYNAIRAFITGAVEHRNAGTIPLTQSVGLKEIFYDPYNARQISTDLTTDGLLMVEHRQGPPSMSGPSKEFLWMIGRGSLNHGNNPIARWMATCTQFEPDRRENICPVKPDRYRSIKRIDGIVTAIMAVGRLTVPKEQQPVPGIAFF
jgi:phage terminase large subunit-like protein